MRRIVCVLTVILSFMLPAFAQTSDLIRLTNRDDLFGWEAVGRVELGGEGYCTGVLIAPDLVLTAGHCAFDRKGRQIPPENLTFRSGLRDGTAIAESPVRKVAVHGNYDPGGGVTTHSIRHDAALLKLAVPISSFAADPFVIHTGAGEGRRVSVVSYGQGRDDALSWQRDCGILGRGNGLMAFDCDVTFGSSGAPVFIKEHGRTRILSLISVVSTGGGPKIAYGMELPKIVDRLKRDLRAGNGYGFTTN